LIDSGLLPVLSSLPNKLQNLPLSAEKPLSESFDRSILRKSNQSLHRRRRIHNRCGSGEWLGGTMLAKFGKIKKTIPND